MPLFLAVAGEAYYPSLKKELDAAAVPKPNRLEIAEDPKTHKVVVSGGAAIPKHDGTVWIFGHGYSDLKKKKGAIFHSFDGATHKGLLFDNAALYEFLSKTVKAQRLYLFACYQGKYLKQYMDGIDGLTFVSGFDSEANRSSAGGFLKGFFGNPDAYKMDKALP